MDETDWHLWRAFLAVVRTGSLSAAARDLRLTQPTLGRQVAALEAALGQALFSRAPDGLRPTDLARQLLPHAEAMGAAAAALRRAATGEAEGVSGTIRLAASEFFGGVVLPPMLARFAAAQPRVTVELSLSNLTEDLLRRDADLAVRNVRPAQASLVARRIGDVPIGFFASRGYAAARGLPGTVADMADHPLVARPEHEGVARGILGAAPRFALFASDDLAVHAALRAGVGIGYCQVPAGRGDPDLLPVLPGTVLASIPVWLAMHEDLRGTRRVRALFDHLAEELARYVAGG
ncbi:LysR family transcriptional regulator [Roseomonas sp. CCTCC AB2023176]|uniref:LysR family transcriptional regulator n=1 Tax=Roseomonas sp. CCTCC AB2023176 TaxID=3342640 RepID=UPI0035DB0B47